MFVIICFGSNNDLRESFNCLANWLTDARTLASPAIVILMVGNKTDLEEEREVTFLEASRSRS